MFRRRRTRVAAPKESKYVPEHAARRDRWRSDELHFSEGTNSLRCGFIFTSCDLL